MPWFKVDDGFHGHPKVLELSLPAVGLWALAGSWCSKYLTDGEITLKAIGRLGGGEGEAEELVTSDLWEEVSPGTYQFRDWADYQPLKADVEAERDAARERMKAVRASKKGANKGGSSTERSESVQPNNIGTFEETSDEVRITPSHPIPTQPEAKASGTRKRATRIPDDFTVTPAMRAWFAEKCPNVNGQRETEKFINHWQSASGKGATKLDWEATWRNWMLTALDRAPQAKTATTTARTASVQALKRSTGPERLELGYGS